jgi:hypothetical protein
VTTLAQMVPAVFWPTIDEIDGLIDRSGVGLPRIGDTLRSISLLDPDKLREVAAVWGVDGADGRPGDLATGIPVRLATITAKVGERWEGEAWHQFSAAMTTTQWIIGRLGPPARELGQLLKDFADDVEASWGEIAGWVIAIAGVVLAAVTWETVIGAVIGAIITVMGLILQAYQSFAPRVAAVNDTVAALEGEIRDRIPRIDDAPIPTPGDGDWHAKTTDPNS